ncbi:MAG TPA: CapA family protein [Candidatus Avidehalobacter gallistercoris]|uniref:CapA family protein n=1 Tax=Candidatus Avidehalobacter gallistercoris TaxID=2840694 RepID=A0A9D1HN08_9FIRM|nr:CapA family protein [Candidatus Avidehalobacter gallistercoris]
MKYPIKKFAMLAVLLLGVLASCNMPEEYAPNIRPTPPPFDFSSKVELSLIAAGDNLIHAPIYRQAKERAGGNGFDFTDAYQPVAELIADADLAYINQETPLGGTKLGLSNYPLFNSPQELGTHLVNMGFNLISQANNHVLDAGKQGFYNTISFWRAQPDVLMAGIVANAEDDVIQVLEYQDVKIALLAYTYGTNGLALPASAEGSVKYIDDDLIKTELAAAQEQADIVLVSMHWGVEYQARPNDEQLRLAQLLADNGADIIIGTHPHVLQTAEMLTAADGRKVPVFYSLGNFISAQDQPATMLGGLAEVDMTYNKADGSLEIDRMAVLPVVTHYTGHYDNITVYPLTTYTAEQAASHGIRSKHSFSREYLVKLFDERIPAELQDRRTNF